MAKVISRLILLLLICLPVLAAAQPTGFGGVANNMMTPVSVVSDFVNSACMLVGGCFIFASVVKFFEHKRSPMMVTMSTVVFLFIAGVVLILLPFVYILTEGGSPFAGLQSLVH